MDEKRRQELQAKYGEAFTDDQLEMMDAIVAGVNGGAVDLGKEGTIAVVKEEIDRLCKWFGRTSVRGTDGERSTGLGLAIARRIVEGHQGRIWVESQVGEGSTFYVSLPIQPDQALSRQE